MALLTRKTQIGLKSETTEGTAVTNIGPNDAAFNLFDSVTFTPEIEQTERNAFRSTIGRRASIAGVKTGTISFTSELVGGGVSSSNVLKPAISELLLPCGFAEYSVKKLSGGSITDTFLVGETVSQPSGVSGVIRAVVKNGSTYDLYLSGSSGTVNSTGSITGATSGATMAPSGAALAANTNYVYTTATEDGTLVKSATVEMIQDGVKHAIKGARGNVTFRGSTGTPLQAVFEFTGPKIDTVNHPLYTGVSYPTNTPPTLLDASFTTHAFSGVIDTVEFSTNNDLQVRRDMNQPSGLISTKIVSRAMGGSIDPEMTVVTGSGSHDWFGNMDTNAEALTQIEVGNSTTPVSGNHFVLCAPNSQYTNITPGERNGIAINTIDLACNESTIGDDDFQIVCL